MINKNELVNEYYIWLCELIGVDQLTRSYWRLAKALYYKQFRWFVPNDDNRAFEAKNLRETFCEELDIDYNLDDFPESVSMLELIIGLAYRCESMMDEMPMSEWFWKLMENCGLYEYHDNQFGRSVEDFVVDEILENIIERRYQRDGTGGLFPLKRPKKDQRRVELWYQMNAYLVENYYSRDQIM